MKKHYVKILSVASIVAGLCAANAAYADMSTFTPTPAGAADVQSDWPEDIAKHRDAALNPAMNPNFDLVSEINKVDIDFMATIEARYSLYDQTRTQNFDFLNQLALFGVHMYKNGWYGDLLVRFAGNPLRSSVNVANAGNPFPNAQQDATGQTLTVDQTGQVGIRKAAIGYKLYHKGAHTLRFSLGRMAPFGQTAYDDDNIVRAWGTDATVNLWGPNGAGNLHGMYIDGAQLSYQYSVEHFRLNMGVMVASDLPMFLYMYDNLGMFNIHANPYQVFGNDSSFGLLSTNASRAWLGDFAFVYSNHWGDIQGAIDVAGKTRSEISNTAGNAIGGSAFATNAWYIAASLGYDLKDKVAVGAWFNWVKTGHQKLGTITAPDEAVVTYNRIISSDGNYTVFGIGVDGSSKLWNQHNIGGKGGVITWGGGYERFMDRKGFNATYVPVFTNSAENDANMFSLELGWARGPVTVAVDWTIFFAENNVFYQSDDSAANNANVLYLVGTFDI